MVEGLILLGTYVVLAVGRFPFVRLDRTGAAVVGAILTVAVGGLSLDAAAHALDYRTLVLLFGMMVLVAHLQLAGFFVRVARAVASHIADPRALLAAIVWAAGLLSAAFVNDPVCLVLTPVVIEIAAARGMAPLPLLLALATGSNIGSVATITGNPQNMLIGSLSGISFLRFTAVLGPVALMGLALDTLVLLWLFRRPLAACPAAPPPPATRVRAGHARLLVKPLVVAAGMLIAFVSGYDTALVAASGAAVLLVTRRVKPDKIWKRIDWDLLMLFVGLFVVVAGAEQAGLDREFFALLEPIGVHTVPGLATMSTVLSNLISNVPAVMLFAPIVPSLPHPELAWLTLAMSSTLAGNLTLLGSIANLIVLEGARRRHVSIGFLDYLAVGVPVTLVTLIFGVWWIY